MSQKKELNKIKSSVFSRGLSIAKLTINTSAKLAGHSISTLLSDENVKQQKWTAFLKDRASGFSKELGELKGSLMKAGQMLSMYGEHFLPPEVNDLLKSLQSQSPPVNYKVIQEILEKQLGPGRLALLEIDPVAIGSASLGQVHKARIISTGEWIALKVQYPNVDKAIDSDLKAIRSFLSMLKVLPNKLPLDPLFAELKSMLVQEMDYKLEAERTIEYRNLLAGDERFIIPKVYLDFSTDKVLATSLEKGINPDDPLVKALSQDRRNKLGEAFLDLYFKELFSWGVVQTDPHLGNYKVRLSADGKDQLVLFDFGAVRSYPDDFLKPYQQMIKASLANDREKLHQAALRLRFVHEGDDPALVKHFEEFCLYSIEPFMDFTDSRNTDGQINSQGEYDWKNSKLPQRLTTKAMQMIQDFHLRPPPKEVIFLDRKTAGVFIFLAVLGAKINGRSFLLPYLEKI